MEARLRRIIILCFLFFVFFLIKFKKQACRYLWYNGWHESNSLKKSYLTEMSPWDMIQQTLDQESLILNSNPGTEWMSLNKEQGFINYAIMSHLPRIQQLCKLPQSRTKPGRLQLLTVVNLCSKVHEFWNI